jgi:hypothetical protein
VKILYLSIDDKGLIFKWKFFAAFVLFLLTQF